MDTLIPRSVNISKSQSFFLFGVRGCGKSTLLKKLFPKDHYYWIDLLDHEQEMRYATNPKLMLNDWQGLRGVKRDNGWIIIDEVQRLPKILDLVHLGIEEHGIKFALTGSSTRKLRYGASNMLAGRAVTFNLFPFTSFELGDGFDLIDTLNFGSLPRAVALRNTPLERRRFLSSYVNTYLREEIYAEQFVQNLAPFRYFLEVAADANGTIINNAKLARQVNLEPRTVQRYFSLLEDTMFGFYLPSFDRSVRQRQAKHPKFYFFDTGVVRAIKQSLKLPISEGSYEFGRLFEHLVILETIRANNIYEHDYHFSYLRTADNAEIDLIASRADNILAIEIKSAKNPDITAIRKITRLTKGIAGCQPYIFCQTDQPTEIEGVRIVPWQQGIHELFGEQPSSS